MTKLNPKTVEVVFLIFFLFNILHALYTGVTTVPSEGDSLAYHIPIAENLWRGGLLHPSGILHYYPSIGEAILSVFLFLHIPLNTFNVIGTLLLFFACKKLGEQVGLKNESSTIFAVSICLLHISLRWIHAQVIDIWLAVFFVWSLALLLKPKKTARYFIILGSSLGLLIGTKNSGLGFAVILLIVYWRNFVSYIDLKKLVYFITPMSFFGLFWYIRNFLLVGNPLYPQEIFGMSGAPGWNILKWNVGKIAFQYPMKLANALMSEYMGWSIALFVALFSREKILVLGLLNLVFFLFLPTTPEYSIIVSSLRYAYPVIIPLILASFLILQKHRKENVFIVLSLANILFLSIQPYQPKLLFLFVPVILLYLHYGRERFNS